MRPIPPPFPFWFPALSEPQVSLRIIPPPRFDSHSQSSNWHKLRFHDNDMHQSANVRQPKQGELQQEPTPIMANLHLSLNALDDICSQLELSWEVSANRQTSRSVLFQHICIHRSANAFTWKYSWQKPNQIFPVKNFDQQMLSQEILVCKDWFQTGGQTIAREWWLSVFVRFCTSSSSSSHPQNRVFPFQFSRS